MGNDNNIDTFLHVVVDAIERIDPISQSIETSYNLTWEDSQPLISLVEDTTITIKPADKGGNLVIRNHKDYLAMCLTILSDKERYRVKEEILLKGERVKRDLESILSEAMVSN